MKKYKVALNVDGDTFEAVLIEAAKKLNVKI